jgi:hypothetical protein
MPALLALLAWLRTISSLAQFLGQTLQALQALLHTCSAFRERQRFSLGLATLQALQAAAAAAAHLQLFSLA